MTFFMLVVSKCQVTKRNRFPTYICTCSDLKHSKCSSKQHSTLVPLHCQNSPTKYTQFCPDLSQFCDFKSISRYRFVVITLCCKNNFLICLARQYLTSFEAAFEATNRICCLKYFQIYKSIGFNVFSIFLSISAISTSFFSFFYIPITQIASVS